MAPYVKVLVNEWRKKDKRLGWVENTDAEVGTHQFDLCLGEGIRFPRTTTEAFRANHYYSIVAELIPSGDYAILEVDRYHKPVRGFVVPRGPIDKLNYAADAAESIMVMFGSAGVMMLVATIAYGLSG